LTRATGRLAITTAALGHGYQGRAHPGVAVRSVARSANRAIAAAVVAAVIWRLGAGPFLAGLEGLDRPGVLAAAAIVLITTVSSAWRWTIVARGLGVRLSLPAAIASSE
jgi:hypothetical protein